MDNQYNKIVIPFNGQLHSVEEWSEILGIAPNTIRERINRGLTASQCLSVERLKKRGGNYKNPTLCWDCANACGGCSWSSREAQPVDGWDATPTKVNMTIEHNQPRSVDSYIVHSCPQFVRDAKNGGHERL